MTPQQKTALLNLLERLGLSTPQDNTNYYNFVSEFGQVYMGDQADLSFSSPGNAASQTYEEGMDRSLPGWINALLLEWEGIVPITHEQIEAWFDIGWSQALNEVLNSQGMIMPTIIIGSICSHSNTGVMETFAAEDERRFGQDELYDNLALASSDIRFEINAITGGAGPAANPAIYGGFKCYAPGFVIPRMQGWMYGIEPEDNGDAFINAEAGWTGLPGKCGIGYIPIVGPRITQGSLSSAVASLFLNNMPAHSISQAVPFFELEVLTPGVTKSGVGADGTESFIVPNITIGTGMGINGPTADYDMNIAGFYGMQHSPADASGSMGSGMELFTAPQTLSPLQFSAHGRGLHNDYLPVDSARPFMSLESFKVSIKPTRGAMSLQEATLKVTLHDRGLLNQIAALVKPDFFGKTSIKVTYGWSHPGGFPRGQGGKEIEDVYGALVDSMKERQTFSLVNSTYSFDPEGQVNITMKLIARATDQVNITDAARTPKYRELTRVVANAYEALDVARESVDFESTTLADVTGNEIISTLTLQNTGQLIDAEQAEAIEGWIATARSVSGGSGSLSDLIGRLQTLQLAVSDAKVQLQTELAAKSSYILTRAVHPDSVKGQAPPGTMVDERFTKLVAIAFNPFRSWIEGVAEGVGVGGYEQYSIPMYNWKGNTYLNTNGKYTSLGDLLYTFLANPLAAGGSFDEIQIVTFCANNNAGAAAGCNLGALPVDVGEIGGKDWGKQLEMKYEEYGGQLPVARFFNWIMEQYIEDQFAACYGLTNGVGTSGGTGNSNYEIVDGEIVASRQSDMGGVQAENEKRLRHFYYGSRAPGSVSAPRPTKFTPCNIKIEFKTHTISNEELDSHIRGSTQKILLNTDVNAGKTKRMLRIIVTDAAARPDPEGGSIYDAFRSQGAGTLSADDTRIYYNGVPEAMRNIFGATRSETSLVTRLVSAGVLKGDITEEDYAAGSALADLQNAELNAQAAYDTLPNRQNYQLLQEAIEAHKLAAVQAEVASGVFRLGVTRKGLVNYLCSQMPNIILGSQGSTVTGYTVATSNNSRNATIFMQRAMAETSGPIPPSPGMPMRLVPSRISLDCLGNPAIQYMQKFFVNTHTGTNIDNVQVVTGIEHTITPTEFKTSVKLTPHDAFATFEGIMNELNGIERTLTELNRLSTS